MLRQTTLDGQVAYLAAAPTGNVRFIDASERPRV